MATGKEPAAVELQSVTKRYGAITAVNNVSLTVEAGTLATLLGPSGVARPRHCG
jgi:iron(III) transport system ATP-binding protein